MDEYSEDMDISVDADMSADIDVEPDIDVDTEVDMEIEDDVIEDDIVEDDVIEDDVIEDDVIEDDVIEDDVIEDDVIEDDVIEDEIDEADLSGDDSIEAEMEEELDEETEEVEDELPEEVEEEISEETEEVEEIEDELPEEIEDEVSEDPSEMEEDSAEMVEDPVEITEEIEEVEDELPEETEEVEGELPTETEEVEEIEDELPEEIEDEVSEDPSEMEEDSAEIEEDPVEITEEIEEVEDELPEGTEEIEEEAPAETEEVIEDEPDLSGDDVMEAEVEETATEMPEEAEEIEEELPAETGEIEELPEETEEVIEDEPDLSGDDTMEAEVEETATEMPEEAEEIEEELPAETGEIEELPEETGEVIEEEPDLSGDDTMEAEVEETVTEMPEEAEEFEEELPAETGEVIEEEPDLSGDDSIDDSMDETELIDTEDTDSAEDVTDADDSEDEAIADINTMDEAPDQEDIAVEEPVIEEGEMPQQHTFDDWLNPENYDEDGHYIGQGQDFGYKPEGMDTDEYAEQIDQEARDSYAEHLAQQDMSWEEQAEAYTDYVEAQENYGNTSEFTEDTMEEIAEEVEDAIPDDVIDEYMNDAEESIVDNNEVIQDIEADIIPEDNIPEEVIFDDYADTTDTMEMDNSNNAEQSPFEAWLDPNNYDADGHYVENPENITDDTRWNPVQDEIPPVDMSPINGIPPQFMEEPEIDFEKPIDSSTVSESIEAANPDVAKPSDRPAMDAMTAYMYEHNYGRGDYPEYSQDPEWQRLNQALQEELGIPVDIPAYDTDNLSNGSTESMSADPAGNTEPANVVNTPSTQTSRGEALDAMTEYMCSHNYGKGDYAEYSQDPEWQRLNEALQEELGIPKDTIMENPRDKAAKDLVENYDVGKADFHDFDPDVASAVADAVKDAKSDFPDLEINYIGSIDSQVGGIREEYIDYYTKELEKIPDSGWTKDEMRTIAEYNADKTISSWGLDDTEGTFAWSLNIPKDADPTGGNLEQYNGVAINNTYASDYAGFKEAKETEVEIKHKPVGCDTPRATIDHELGHEIDNLLNASNDQKLKDMYNSMMANGNAENELSGYSQTNIKEFIAEGYSEYRNNPKPREYATKIYERLKELNEIRRRDAFWKRK